MPSSRSLFSSRPKTPGEGLGTVERVEVEREEADQRLEGQLEVLVDQLAPHVYLEVRERVFDPGALHERVLRGEHRLDLAQLADRLQDLHDRVSAFSQQLRQVFVHQVHRLLDRAESRLPDVRLHALAQDREALLEVRVSRLHCSETGYVVAGGPPCRSCRRRPAGLR